MEGDESDTATVTVDVPRETTTEDNSTVVIVDAPSDDSGESVEHAVDAAVETERRFAHIESRLDDVESRSWNTPTYSDVENLVDTAAEAVEMEAAAAAVVVAEETAEQASEESADDITPHKTHWLHRSWAEWTGRDR